MAKPRLQPCRHPTQVGALGNFMDRGRTAPVCRAGVLETPVPPAKVLRRHGMSAADYLAMVEHEPDRCPLCYRRACRCATKRYDAFAPGPSKAWLRIKARLAAKDDPDELS